jgi:alkylated DNA repair dioxygenase AlkB
MKPAWPDPGLQAVLEDQASGSFVSYRPGYIGELESMQIAAELADTAEHFEGGTMLVDGREVCTPRLVVAFGDAPYAYPDMGASLPWPPAITSVRDRLATLAGHKFNYVLVNWYRDGNDYAGWHADKMQMHVAGSTIAIVSLGSTRRLQFRTLPDAALVTEIPLETRSLLLMGGETQAHYEHSIPLEPDDCERRYSLTFRYVRETATERPDGTDR